jgi:urease alpha subunit
MLMVCHHLNAGVPEDVAFANRASVPRRAAEDAAMISAVEHDVVRLPAWTRGLAK